MFLQMIDGELTEKILKPTGGDEAENSRMMRQVFTLGELAQGGNSTDSITKFCSYDIMDMEAELCAISKCVEFSPRFARTASTSGSSC